MLFDIGEAEEEAKVRPTTLRENSESLVMNLSSSIGASSQQRKLTYDLLTA